MSIQVNEEALEELKKQLTPKGIGKVVLGTLVSLGATAAVIAAFRNPMKGTKGLLKILMAAGIFVLGCKAGDIAEEHCGEMIDEAADTIGEFFKELTKSEGGTQQNGGNTNDGRNTKQQSKKQGNGSGQRADAAENNGKAPASSIWRRWRGKKEGTKQVLGMDEKDVFERPEPEGHPG